MSRTSLPALLLAFMLASCASIPLSSLVALQRIDFQTTDFAALRVAVQLPDAIRTRSGSVRMIATVSYDGGAARKETLFLQEAGDDTAASASMRQGYHTRGFRLRDEDVVRLETIRSEIKAARADGRKGSLGFGIEAKEFCRAGEISSGPLLITTFLRTVETIRFIPLIRDFDLRSDKQFAEEAEKLAPC
jgi:hypothetical protein